MVPSRVLHSPWQLEPTGNPRFDSCVHCRVRGCLLTQDDYFALSRAGESLQSHVPGSLRAIVMTLGEIHCRAWGDLLQSVRTGSPAFNGVFGTGLFDYLQRDAETADAFNDGMTDLSSLLVYAILMASDFSGISLHCRHRRWAGEIAPKHRSVESRDQRHTLRSGACN